MTTFAYLIKNKYLYTTILAVTLAMCIIFLRIPYIIVLISALIVALSFSLVEPESMPHIIGSMFIIIMYINLVKIFSGFRYLPIVLDLALVYILFVTWVNLILRHERIGFNLKFEILLITFLIISVFQIFNPNTPSVLAGLYGFRKTSYHMLAIFLGIYSLRSCSDIDKILKYLCWGSLPILAYGIKQYFFFSSFDQKLIDINYASYYTGFILGKNRAMSIFSGPFHFGMFAAIISLISYHLYKRTAVRTYVSICLLAMTGVFASLTRTNIMAAVISFLFLLLFYGKRTSNLKPVTLAVVIALALTFYLYYNPSYETSLFPKLIEDKRFMHRFVTWRNVWNSFLQNPLIGYGMGSSGDAMTKLYPWKVHFTAHNLFLKILHETGVVGFFLYVSMAILWLREACILLKKDIDTQYRQYTIVIVSIALVFFVNAMVGSAVEAYPVNVYIWFFVGILFKVGYIARKTKETDYV